MVFNATFNNISVISWRSVLVVKETGVSEYIFLFVYIKRFQINNNFELYINLQDEI